MTELRRVLVVGFGSIGARHARLIAARGLEAAVVSRRVVEWPLRFVSIAEACAGWTPQFAVVATETAAHLPALRELRRAGFAGPVLIEKPLAAALPADDEIAALAPGNVRVAYNLRFHPAIQRLKAALEGKDVISASLYAGQDLRAWRPGRAAESTYSADRRQGGGVLRDLSHELDYFQWIFGRWIRLTAAGGHVGPLPIDADDCWSIVTQTERCRVGTIQLDYYHRRGARLICVNTADGTLEVDLIRHTFQDGSELQSFAMERDSTYVAQLDAFLREESGVLCSFEEALASMRMIEAVERAATADAWVRS